MKVRCNICSGMFSRLGNHVGVHGITITDYREKFPESPTCGYTHSPETLKKMRGPRPSVRGVPKSEEHRKALSEARKGKKFKPHSPETIEKMRLSWERRKANKETYKAYVNSVSERMSTPEMILIIRERTANLIKSKNHNGKSSGTSLEVRMEKFLDSKGLSYETQKIVNTPKGSFTFDFFVEEKNLLVEVDGEYWHRKSLEQFNRDIIKERLAIDMGYRFLRISDKDWKPDMVFETEDHIRNHNKSVMDKRKPYIPSSKQS